MNSTVHSAVANRQQIKGNSSCTAVTTATWCRARAELRQIRQLALEMHVTERERDRKMERRPGRESIVELT